MQNRALLITGVSGFIGKALADRLTIQNVPFYGVSRKINGNHNHKVITDFLSFQCWTELFYGVHTVVHLAGKAHGFNKYQKNLPYEFIKANTLTTILFARNAAAAGVKRFIFVSSIGVSGFQTPEYRPFSENDVPLPHNDYASSKWEAEQGLLTIARETGIEVVIIRPPLVYGPNPPGNFGSLVRAVRCGWPLPLGAVLNQRSLVALDNLVDFIITCINHPNAANETFLISDGHDLSTADLIRTMAKAAGVPARLISMPVWLLELSGRILGKSDLVQSLCGNLQVDSSKARKLLDWSPPVSVEEGIRRAMVGSL